MKGFIFIVSMVLGLSSLGAAKEGAKVLFIAGEPSHGWNLHEFPAGCRVLAEALNESGLGIEATVSLGWPEDDGAFEGVDTVIVYCDGADLHLANDKAGFLDTLYESGVSFGFLHFAVEPGSEALAAFLLKSIGGYFEVDWSVNPVWSLENSVLAQRVATSGVASLEIKDEWYYHMRFREDGDFEPLLSAHPPESTLGKDGPRSGNPTVRSALKAKALQPLGWTRVGAKGQRGFGFTGGHFHKNWNDGAFRKLVLNAIAWTAGVDLPETGIVSKYPSIVTYKTIDEAIARGDLADMEIHLNNEPSLLDAKGRSKMTPLQQAVMRKKVAAAEILLARGADPNLQTGSQQTALHLAVARNLPEVCRLLGEYGIDLHARDKQGWTALHLAAAKNQLETVRALISIGADANFLSAAGGTPLHEAAASGGAEVIALLLGNGSDPKRVSSHGVTAIDIAIEFKNEAAIEALSGL